MKLNDAVWLTSEGKTQLAKDSLELIESIKLFLGTNPVVASTINSINVLVWMGGTIGIEGPQRLKDIRAKIRDAQLEFAYIMKWK